MPDVTSPDTFIRLLPNDLMQVILQQQLVSELFHALHQYQHRRRYRNVLEELQECFPKHLMDEYYVTEHGTWVFLFSGRSSGEYFPAYLLLESSSVRRIIVAHESRWWVTIHASSENDNKWFLTFCHPPRTHRTVAFEYAQFSAAHPLIRIPSVTIESMYRES